LCNANRSPADNSLIVSGIGLEEEPSGNYKFVDGAQSISLDAKVDAVVFEQFVEEMGTEDDEMDQDEDFPST